MTVTSLDESNVAQHIHVSDPTEPHKTDLLEQFYLTLRVTYMAAPLVAPSVVHERIDRLFNDVHTWRNAYEIEQLLCFVLSPEQLETELQRRLAEAVALKLEYVTVINQELQGTDPPPDRRILLHRLLNDLQWFYSKRNQHRAAGKRLMVRVSLLFMVALATFSLVLFIQFFAHGAGTTPAAAAPSAANQGTQGQQNTPAGAAAGRGANQPPQGQANPPGGDASTNVANAVATDRTTTNEAIANPATPNRSAQDQPNTTGGAK
jgi:hypothetical protein